MMTSFAKSVLAAAALSLTLGASADELKIGYVNAERVLREAAPAKAAQAKLESEFKRRETELNDTGARLKAAMDKLDKDGPTLSEAERDRRQRDLSDQQRDFDRKRRELLEDLNQRKNEELAAVTERASKVIKQIFEQGKYDLIVQDVVFASPKVDITQKVIDALNQPGSGK